MKNEKNRQDAERLEWLVDRLREAEEERDNALGCLNDAQLDNYLLSEKLRAIADVVHKAEYLIDDDADDYEIPCEDEDVLREGEDILREGEDVLREKENSCGMPSI